MNPWLTRLIAAAWMTTAWLAQAGEPPKPPPPQNPPPATINLQTATGASCSAPAVGQCGSCAISCPTGQAAMCRPGLTVGSGKSGESCVQAPDCSCH